MCALTSTPNHKPLKLAVLFRKLLCMKGLLTLSIICFEHCSPKMLCLMNNYRQSWDTTVTYVYLLETKDLTSLVAIHVECMSSLAFFLSVSRPSGYCQSNRRVVKYIHIIHLPACIGVLSICVYQSFRLYFACLLACSCFVWKVKAGEFKPAFWISCAKRRPGGIDASSEHLYQTVMSW